MSSRALKIFKTATAGTRLLPLSALVPLVEAGTARLGPRLMADKASMMDRHLKRVAAHSHRPSPPTAAAGLASYGRYWAETFRLPSLGPKAIDRGFSFVDYDRIEEVRAAGYGPILVLPHLGGWEWAAAWLGRIAGTRVTAVVEHLEPEDLFQWFDDLRSSYGVDVVPLGSDTFARLLVAVRQRNIICLLADRDIGGTGIEVEFFGETTKLPAGPAVLSWRTGAPLLPVAVYFTGRQRLCRVGRPIWPGADDGASGQSDGSSATTTGGRRGRQRFQEVTQQLAVELERLITMAPEQWHLLEPNWPSDRGRDREQPAD